MKKTEICRKITDLGAYGTRTLVYSMTADGSEAAENVTEYGAEITVYESGESACVKRITPDAEKARRFIDILATNFVTPVALNDIVQDWVER